MIEYSKIIYEKIKEPFIKFCIKLNLTANHVTLINHAITLTLGCYFFSRGSYLFYLLAFVICIINGLLDYLDGDLARTKKGNQELGEWLDSGFDVVIQNAILGAIGIGCYKQGLPLSWVMVFMVGNSASNYVSFFYNEKFGFSSSAGNRMFREYMEKKDNLHNTLLKQIIDPTCDWFALSLFTYRYFIAIGCLFNLMPLCFIIMTIITNIRWFVMYFIYALYLHNGYNLHILKALSVLDDERNEFYAQRSR